MKIISRQELIAAPAGTIYCEFRGLNPLGDWLRKGESLENDWFACDLMPDIVLDGTDPDHPYYHVGFSTIEGRDGVFDDSIKYLISDGLDQWQLINTINGFNEKAKVLKIEEEDQ